MVLIWRKRQTLFAFYLKEKNNQKRQHVADMQKSKSTLIQKYKNDIFITLSIFNYF